VWTGSNIDGTAADGLTLGDTTVRIGSSRQTDGRWINFGTSSYTNRNSYYALSEELTVHFAINAGLSDAWFNPQRPGQGIFITVFPDIGKLFLAWFTFDLERPSPDVTAMLGEPGHRWLTALGDYSGKVATLDVELTSGGMFDSGPNPKQSPGYGTITLDFSDCETLTMRYDLPSLDEYSYGVISMTRLATDKVALCEELMVRAASE
jgi:hypothetical protein